MQAADETIPYATRPKGDTSIKGRWTGPNVSPTQQLSDANKVYTEAYRLMQPIWDGDAATEQAQYAADTIWLMSHEVRQFPIRYDTLDTSTTMQIADLLRNWVTEAGLSLSQEAQTAGVPWVVFRDRLGHKMSPIEARNRYGGLDGRSIITYLQDNHINWWMKNPGGLEEVLIGPRKDYDDGIGDATFRDRDGNNLTIDEARTAFGAHRADSWEEYAEMNGLTILVHPDDIRRLFQESRDGGCADPTTTGSSTSSCNGSGAAAPEPLQRSHHRASAYSRPERDPRS